MELEWINFQQATFYAAVWLVAFLVALARSLALSSIESIRVSIFSSSVVGFLALGVTAIWTGNNSDGFTGHISYLGYSIILGLAGPWHEKIITNILKSQGLLKSEDRKTDSE